MHHHLFCLDHAHNLRGHAVRVDLHQAFAANALAAPPTDVPVHLRDRKIRAANRAVISERDDRHGDDRCRRSLGEHALHGLNPGVLFAGTLSDEGEGFGGSQDLPCEFHPLAHLAPLLNLKEPSSIDPSWYCEHRILLVAYVKLPFQPLLEAGVQPALRVQERVVEEIEHAVPFIALGTEATQFALFDEGAVLADQLHGPVQLLLDAFERHGVLLLAGSLVATVGLLRNQTECVCEVLVVRIEGLRVLEDVFEQEFVPQNPLYGHDQVRVEGEEARVLLHGPAQKLLQRLRRLLLLSEVG
mmetsp:Transcript_1376/g.2979  ORF Transcript_1376/g.2979 Transcript_1376/m.2979 type:complete len:300 (+) Transcript_1376:359-1258(+)